MTTVYVLNKEGNPLDPTTRCGHVRILLKTKKARVVRMKPFTIQLLYETKGETKVMYGGTDPGRTNIGNAVITENGECVYRDVVETRNKDIPKLMAERKAHRQASRRGEHLRRKRRARKAGTLSTKLDGRLIPGTEEPTPVKDIINTEARFMNRKKVRAICPTVNHLVETTLHHVDDICSLLPIRGWCLEVNRFSFMAMDGGAVFGTDFQNGRMRGYDTVEEYVFAMQNGRCLICGGPIDACHHIIPRGKGGSDLPENRAGLCNDCHSKVHQGKLSLSGIGEKKRYGALSVLNQAIPYIYKGLAERFGEENISICSGSDTMMIREAAGLEKGHDIDALCIASVCTDGQPKAPETGCCRLRQFRRQDRALINNQTERTYKLDGRIVAKNRKPRYEQQGLSLKDWHEEMVSVHGKEKADSMLSRLKARKSCRRYNDRKRLMPGAVIRWNGFTGVLTGQQNNGYYFMMDKLPGKRLKAADCTVLRHNTGIVCM